jgi:hypothetical protein
MGAHNRERAKGFTASIAAERYAALFERLVRVSPVTQARVRAAA